MTYQVTKIQEGEITKLLLRIKKCDLKTFMYLSKQGLEYKVHGDYVDFVILAMWQQQEGGEALCN